MTDLTHLQTNMADKSNSDKAQVSGNQVVTPKVLYCSRKIPVGAKIWFAEEKQGYIVRASNVAFCVLTKPLNIHKTVLYTIIDWERGERNYENLVFGFGAETDEQCEEMLERLTNFESEVSQRHPLPVKIVGYYEPQIKERFDGLVRMGTNPKRSIL